jgi:SAM-dependent methyltransferase
MKTLDRLLRAWRTRVALNHIPRDMHAVLDVGCGDGHLLARLQAATRDGVDPSLVESRIGSGMRLLKGMFPGDLAKLGITGPYDAIFFLAVFEHLTEADFHQARDSLPNLLRPGGRIIITVPHPLVDKILEVLMFVRLIEGQAVHEHHGFEPGDILALPSDRLRLRSHSRFQFGLNNLFVFERI